MVFSKLWKVTTVAKEGRLSFPPPFLKFLGSGRRKCAKSLRWMPLLSWKKKASSSADLWGLFPPTTKRRWCKKNNKSKEIHACQVDEEEDGGGNDVDKRESQSNSWEMLERYFRPIFFFSMWHIWHSDMSMTPSHRFLPRGEEKGWGGGRGPIFTLSFPA